MFLHFFRLHSLVAPGDTVRVIGKFDHQGKCVVDSTHNFVIINPDILISGTRVILLFYFLAMIYCTNHSAFSLCTSMLYLAGKLFIGY